MFASKSSLTYNNLRHLSDAIYHFDRLLSTFKISMTSVEVLYAKEIFLILYSFSFLNNCCIRLNCFPESSVMRANVLFFFFLFYNKVLYEFANNQLFFQVNSIKLYQYKSIQMHIYLLINRSNICFEPTLLNLYLLVIHLNSINNVLRQILSNHHKCAVCKREYDSWTEFTPS